MLKIITIHQELEWREYIQKSANFDFYHTWYYHSLDDSGDPLLVVYSEGDDFIAFPLIRRPIPESEYNDLTCVYGYTGPVSNKEFNDLDDNLMENFKTAFLDYLHQNKNISVFSRLHSFFNQSPLMNKFGGVYENGKIVVIDLKVPLETQRSGYQKRLLEKIQQLRRKGFYVKQGGSPEDVREFASIYSENMERIGASDFYLFSEEYFTNMLASTEYNSKLMLVYQGTQAVCGAIVVYTKQIIQAHLLGTRTEYLSHSPAKLLTDEICLFGREMGLEYFNLGGGLGYKEDSLFEWKAAFSHLFINFTSWRYIADKKTYTLLLDKTGLAPDAKIDFFPLYRYKLD
jgi:lipid II:glycine glycyltransferase (peptidoglycan interpeptide bridge formation enzyme)